MLIMAALRSRCRHCILPPVVSVVLLFFSPNISGRWLDVYHTSTHDVASANLDCISEMCCTRLSGNIGRESYAKNRHLRAIAPVCRAISSQLRHVLTIRKKLVCLSVVALPMGVINVFTAYRPDYKFSLSLSHRPSDCLPICPHSDGCRSKNESLRSQNRTTPSPILHPKHPF